MPLRFKKIFSAFTIRERAVFFFSGSVTIVSGVWLAAIVIGANTIIVPAQGGEYTEGFVGQPVYVNPILASTDVDKSLVRLIFSSMRDLAETITPSEDGRTWKVRLKENLRWHDGEKLTSDDVVFTVQKIQDRESRSPLFDAWQGAAIQRLSELEIQFSLINPYAFFSNTLERLYILPKHIFGEVPATNWRLSDYNLKPIGSGPFVFRRYEKRTDGFIHSYTASSWSAYPKDRPLIDSATFMFFSKKTDLIQAFNLGKLDGFAGAEPEELALVERPHEIARYSIPNYYAVFFNQNKNVPLKDPEVRKALTIAIDPDTLVVDALLGFGKPAIGPIPQSISSIDQSIIQATSLDAAEETLNEAGWKINDEGFREKNLKNSTLTLELAITVPQIGFLTKTAELLKQSWEKIGVKITIETLPAEEIAERAIKDRAYETLLFGNALNQSFDLFSFWHSSQRFYPGLNFALYNNKKADSIIESIRQTLDAKTREAKLRELQQTIINDSPALFLYSPEYIFISAKNLRGAAGKAINEPAERFMEARYWYVKTARVLK